MRNKSKGGSECETAVGLQGKSRPGPAEGTYVNDGPAKINNQSPVESARRKRGAAHADVGPRSLGVARDEKFHPLVK